MGLLLGQSDARHGRGRRCEEKPGAMETQRLQQKFLTLECEGRSGTSSRDSPLLEGTLGYFVHFILPRGLLRVSVLAAIFNVTFQRRESEEQPGARKLTPGPAVPLERGDSRGVAWGWGASMRGPWTERRSWPCPACVRCGRSCCRCSPAGPRATGCEYGDLREAWRGRWSKGAFDLRLGEKGCRP